MKTVLKIWCILIAWAVMVSCAENELPGVGNHNDSIIEYKKLSIHAEITDAEIPVVVTEGFEMDLYGVASACNLSDQACFSMTGFIKNLDAMGRFEIHEGEIDLLAENTGCNLTGSFSGHGLKNGNNFEIAATINVSCGTGSFQADAGELRLTINGTLPDENVETMNYVMNIYGYLAKKK